MCAGRSNKHTLLSMSPTQDAQNVPAVVQLLYDEQLQVRLLQSGDAVSAATMRLLGVMHMVFDVKNLTLMHRSQQLQLCKSVLVELRLEPTPDSVRAVAAGSNYFLMGITRQAVTAWVCNIETREHLLKRFPGLVDLMVERFFSTDDLELEFSCLVTGVRGCKPTARVAYGYLRRLDFLTMLRRRYPDFNISVAASSRRRATATIQQQQPCMKSGGVVSTCRTGRLFKSTCSGYMCAACTLWD